MTDTPEAEVWKNTPSGRQPIPQDADTIARTVWKPTENQMTAYKNREVEMCVTQIQNVKGLRQDHTLFSFRTWEAAHAKLAQAHVTVPEDAEHQAA